MVQFYRSIFDGTTHQPWGPRWYWSGRSGGTVRLRRALQDLQTASRREKKYPYMGDRRHHAETTTPSSPAPPPPQLLFGHRSCARTDELVSKIRGPWTTSRPSNPRAKPWGRQGRETLERSQADVNVVKAPGRCPLHYVRYTTV